MDTKTISNHVHANLTEFFRSYVVVGFVPGDEAERPIMVKFLPNDFDAVEISQVLSGAMVRCRHSGLPSGKPTCERQALFIRQDGSPVCQKHAAADKTYTVTMSGKCRLSEYVPDYQI